jgi:hypothetical protein
VTIEKVVAKLLMEVAKIVAVEIALAAAVKVVAMLLATVVENLMVLFLEEPCPQIVIKMNMETEQKLFQNLFFLYSKKKTFHLT